MFIPSPHSASDALYSSEHQTEHQNIKSRLWKDYMNLGKIFLLCVPLHMRNMREMD